MQSLESVFDRNRHIHFQFFFSFTKIYIQLNTIHFIIPAQRIYNFLDYINTFNILKINFFSQRLRLFPMYFISSKFLWDSAHAIQRLQFVVTIHLFSCSIKFFLNLKFCKHILHGNKIKTETRKQCTD